MGRYILRRLLQMIPVILGVTILVFTILYFIPGDPVRLLLGAEPTPAQVEAKREAMGLNDPYLVRLGRYVEGIVLHFDFGKSWIYNTPVTTELLQRFPRTLTIAVICMLMQILIGTPLGIIAAVNRNGWGDRISMFIAMFGISMPNFWIALMLVLFFSVKLGWLPPFGIGGIEISISFPVLPMPFPVSPPRPGRHARACWKSSVPTTSPLLEPRACLNSRF